MLHIVDADQPAAREAIAQILQAHPTRLQQEAVLRVQSCACVST